MESFGKPGVKAMGEALVSEAPPSEMDRAKNALLHPETELLPDPNKPFRQLEEKFAGLEISDEFVDELLAGGADEELSPEEEEDSDEAVTWACLILEFIIVGFNRQSDTERERYRVSPTWKPPWLLLAVLVVTSLEHYNITLESLRRQYKLRRVRNKIVDFQKVLAEEPMSRMHRRMVEHGKAAGLKLKNDRVIVNAARTWYQCRVVHGSVAKYCDAQAQQGLVLDPKNVNRQIRPCDDALGYVRRLPKR